MPRLGRQLLQLLQRLLLAVLPPLAAAIYQTPKPIGVTASPGAAWTACRPRSNADPGSSPSHLEPYT